MASDLDSRMRKGELRLRQGFMVGGPALFVAMVSAIVGAMRRRRPIAAPRTTLA